MSDFIRADPTKQQQRPFPFDDLWKRQTSDGVKLTAHEVAVFLLGKNGRVSEEKPIPVMREASIPASATVTLLADSTGGTASQFETPSGVNEYPCGANFCHVEGAVRLERSTCQFLTGGLDFGGDW